jgi:ketosteroid isomerase-like protein
MGSGRRNINRPSGVDTDYLALVRHGNELFNQGDIAALAKTWHPDIVWKPSGAYLDLDAEVRGRDATLQFFQAFRDAWSEVRLELERLIELSPTCVLALGTFHAIARDGMAVQRAVGYRYSFANGLCTEAIAYASWDEALEQNAGQTRESE